MLASLFKFRGGVKPASHKDESTQAPIARAPLPAQLVVPLRQSAGGTPRSIAVAADGRLLVSGDVGQGGQFFGSFTTYAYVGEGTADLDGDGIPNAVEASEGRNYRQRDNDVLASARRRSSTRPSPSTCSIAVVARPCGSTCFTRR